MSLAEAFQRGIDALFTAGGVSATYTERNGSPVTVTVLVDYDLEPYGDTAEVSSATATIAVRVSEVQYPPRQGDTFQVGAETFVVASPVNSDELEHRSLVS